MIAKNSYPFMSHTPPHPIATHQSTSHTQHNTQGPKATKNLTRGPIGVLKLWVAVFPKQGLMCKYFLWLKLWSYAWLCNGSRKNLKISTRGKTFCVLKVWVAVSPKRRLMRKYWNSTSVIWSLTMIQPLWSAMLPSITVFTKIPQRSSVKKNFLKILRIGKIGREK